MSYGLNNYVNNKVRDSFYYFLTVLQLDIKKRRMWFLKFLFLHQIGMDVKNQSDDF